MDIRQIITAGPYEPTWESLRSYRCPEWFKDAKLGIWAHWGPQCVPMFGDWYARHLYTEGHDQYLHHWRTYGHPSKVGYKDLVTLWKAENFDADVLMDLYVRAGAKYFVAQAVHHDNFDNWDSAHNKWNSVNLGPQRDIVRLWMDSAKRHGLPFGLSEHLGASFSWWQGNKKCDKTGPYAGIPYDASDSEYEDLYHLNKDDASDWYTSNPMWHERWFARIKDLVDKYQPSLLYSDGGVPFGDYGLGIIAHLYNTSARLNGGENRAVYNQKDRNPEVFTVGVLDIERGGEADIFAHPWQTDTCVGGWFYDVRARYKTPRQVVQMLIDIVAKNGNLLLNLPQRPDGTLDDECIYIAEELGKWMAVNSEGIYGTRPWTVAGEGPTKGESGAFKEQELPFGAADFRFTAKDSTVYAFQLAAPEDGQATLTSFANVRVCAVDVLMAGASASANFEQSPEALRITIPEGLQLSRYAHCFRIGTCC